MTSDNRKIITSDERIIMSDERSIIIKKEKRRANEMSDER